MRGLSRILSLFRDDLNKFIDTEARILDSISYEPNTTQIRPYTLKQTYKRT